MFAAHPIFGLGLPGDASFHFVYTGFLYFPDDLGPLGILGSYGVVGLLWVLSLLFTLVATIRPALHSLQPETFALAYAGLFVMLTTATSPSIFQGDAGLVFGLAFAVGSRWRVQIRARQTGLRPSRLPRVST